MVLAKDADEAGLGPRWWHSRCLAEEVMVVTTLAGEFLLNLLEQDQVWVTRDGRRLAIEEMEWSHRRNVLVMLERQLGGLYREWLTEFLDEGVTFEELARLGWVAVDPWIGRYRPAGARTWFEGQPLVVRLRALLGPEPSLPT